ncbi:hypothetical protein BPJM79_120061 [Bacillus pumilus]
MIHSFTSCLRSLLIFAMINLNIKEENIYLDDQDKLILKGGEQVVNKERRRRQSRPDHPYNEAPRHTNGFIPPSGRTIAWSFPNRPQISRFIKRTRAAHSRRIK